MVGQDGPRNMGQNGSWPVLPHLLSVGGIISLWFIDGFKRVRVVNIEFRYVCIIDLTLRCCLTMKQGRFQIVNTVCVLINFSVSNRVRNYTPKSNRFNWSAEQLELAVKAVDGGTSVRKGVKSFAVPRTIIQGKLAGVVNSGQRRTIKPVFTAY